MQLVSYILHLSCVLMLRKLLKIASIYCWEYNIFPFCTIKYATCIKEVIIWGSDSSDYEQQSPVESDAMLLMRAPIPYLPKSKMIPKKHACQGKIYLPKPKMTP